MKENTMEPIRLEPTMAQKEAWSFEHLRQRCSYRLSHEQFQAIYRPIQQQLGISSPAVMLFPGIAKALKADEILGKDAVRDIVIAIDTEILPDPEYADYLLEHECWEVYISHKEGFNLKNIDTKDSSRPLLERRRPAHRYSCYREFALAVKAGKGEEYMAWWRDFYSQDKARVDQMSAEELQAAAPAYGATNDLKGEIKAFIDQNQAIKEWAYHKAQETEGRELQLAEVA